ncbi:succinate dehydrogenase, cytochrome b556 subunit [Alsobacter sp. R-9]
MADSRLRIERPLSPHIQIYRPMLTMMMSIIHRITGAALYFGTVILAFWLIMAASGPAGFATAQAVLGSFLGRILLFGYTWALLHHMLGGIRHLIWDTGRGFGPVERELFARLTLGGSVVLTVLLWIVAYAVR